jgi:hypothetical protein
MKKPETDEREQSPEPPSRPKLTVEELERRVAPAVANKKAPIPPPYAPGTLYGLVRRDSLSWMKEPETDEREQSPEPPSRPKLTVEELEKRVAPAVADKKAPIPPAYPPGSDYGLVRRDNLSW